MESALTTTRHSVEPKDSKTSFSKYLQSKLKCPILPNQNRLVHAAGKIFSIITELRQRREMQDISQLKPYLTKELQRFQTAAEKVGYDLDGVLVGRYSLSACLDETINKTAWGIQFNWKNQSLLGDLQQDTTVDERFFVILDKMCRAPKKFIDIIELMYICLNLGFEGKFRHQPFEKHRLRQIINVTYQIIRAQRGEFDKQLSPSLQRQSKKIKPQRSFPFTSILLAGFLVAASLYLGINYLLSSFSDEILQQFQTMTKTLSNT